MAWSQIFLELTMSGGGPVFGESETVGYEKQIVLLDFDWGMTAKEDTLQNKTIKRTVEFGEITLSKRFDLSSTALYWAMTRRTPIKTGRVSVPQSFAVQGAANQGKRDAFALEFSDGYIESIDLDMVEDGNAMVLQERIEVRFSKIKVEVTPVNPDGSYARAPLKSFDANVDGQVLK